MNLFVFIALVAIVTPLSATTVYKYQDKNGKWVFSDTKPKHTEPEEITLKKTKNKKIRPNVYVKKSDFEDKVVVFNPYYAPIQIKVVFGENRKTVHKIVNARENIDIDTLENKKEKFQYRWVLGDPNQKQTGHQEYQVPIQNKGKYKISQGFNGKFSHSKEPSLYAIDIAMPVGTDLVAARSGVVISVKDDYHMGGKDNFFLDKANYVKVLHADGTYATYAHVLLGSVIVQPGDKVEVGQKLARSGTSGYSTGPHLHFVIRKNVGMKTGSVPFTLLEDSGKPVQIKKGAVIIVSGK